MAPCKRPESQQNPPNWHWLCRHEDAAQRGRARPVHVPREWPKTGKELEQELHPRVTADVLDAPVALGFTRVELLRATVQAIDAVSLLCTGER